MSALSEGHLAAVIFCVLGDSLVFCWEDFSFFFLFFPPFYPPFPFFCGFLVYWSGKSQFCGVVLYSAWSYIPPASMHRSLVICPAYARHMHCLLVIQGGLGAGGT